MFENLTVRNTIELAQKWLRIAERQREGYSFIGSRGFDIGELPILDPKAYPGDRDPDEIDLGMMHCTGVTEGFGVQKYGPTGTDHARKLIVSGELRRIAPNLWEQMDHAGMFLRLEEAVRFLALALRYRNTPYHVIGSQAGYIFRNRRPKQASWHGQGTRTSGGNKGLGIAFDASPSTKLTPFFIETCIAAIRTAHLVWYVDQLEHGPRLIIVCHAQAKWPGRANDPGKNLWQLVVVPAVLMLREEGFDVAIDTMWRYGTGRKPEWMTAA